MSMPIETRTIRAKREMSILETKLSENIDREVVLLRGIGREAIDVFCDVASSLAPGSAVVIDGVARDSVEVSIATEVAMTHGYRPWPSAFSSIDAWACCRTIESAMPYGSHLRHLIDAVKVSSGDVLELGAGHSSTPALHAVCARLGKRLITVESDPAWIAKFAWMSSDFHVFELCANPAKSQRLNEHWGVVFVDHEPWKTRGEAVWRARSRADLVVVHDTESLSYGMEPLLCEFRHRADFRKVRPWTTVVSDSIDVDTVFSNMIIPEFSIMIPTRDRSTMLTECIESFSELADDPESIEFILRFDDDDKSMSECMSSVMLRQDTLLLCGERWGYSEIHRYWNHTAEHSRGKKLFVVNDDVLMLTPGWDTLLRSVNKHAIQFIRRDSAVATDCRLSVFDRVVYDAMGHISAAADIDGWTEGVARASGIIIFRDDVVNSHVVPNDRTKTEALAAMRLHKPSRIDDAQDVFDRNITAIQSAIRRVRDL